MRRFLLVLLLVALPQSALAKAHLWRFTEVFSNADGSVQFIEMFVFDPAGVAEWQLDNMLLESSANSWRFPNDLPQENTFQRWMLIATPAFADLPGAPTPDYVVPAGFFDPAGDELRYRTAIDALELPPGAVPVDGVHAYLRDGSTAANTPTNFAGETGTLDLTRPCADAVDNDEDGFVDFPDDPACETVDSSTEVTECQDGVDNDNGPGTDFDGGASILGVGNEDPDGADPQCLGRPWHDREAKSGCGLGFEAGLVLGVLAWSTRRRGSR